MIRVCSALLLSCVAAGPALAASPDPKSLVIPADELSRARELVRQLGSDQFAEREKAEAELARMGRLARPALLEGVTTDPDPEIRTRCQGLLPKATSQEMKARLAVFLADTEGAYDHDLPGWNQFRTVVRNEWNLFGYPISADRSLDKAARAVFADLISTAANRAVVMAVGGQEAEVGAIVAARRQELYSQKYPRAVVVNGVVTQGARREPTAADIATLLFAESQVPNKAVPRAISMSVLLSSSGFTTAAQGGDEKGRVYKALATAWLETRTDVMEVYTGMSTASTLGLPNQACRLAAKLFATQGAQVYYRGTAAATLARLGNKGHIPLLEKALDDAAVLTTVRRNVVKEGKNELVSYEIQIRDVALAVSIILSGQSIDDYGFVDQYKTNGIGAAGYSYTRHYLADDKRAAAFEKWKAWRAKNP